MLVLSDRLLGMPVMSLQTGAMVARTNAAIIDPRNLLIVAFYCEGGGLDPGQAILHTSDIRETGTMGFIVDSAERIMAPNDLVRLQQVINFHFSLVGKDVIDDGGGKVGKVANYTVDTSSFFVVKLHVKPNFWQSLQTAELLIGRNQIVRVTDKFIVVKAPTIKAKTKPAAEPAKVLVENPFRQPQPNMIERQE